MKRVMLAIVLLAVGTPAALLTSTGDLAAEHGRCPPIPAISWWDITSHEELIKHINRKYGGDWSPYIANWENHLNKVIKAFEQGKGLAVPKNKVDPYIGEVQRKGSVKGDKVILAYEDLGLYIPKLVQRTAVHNCLAGEAASRSKLPEPQAATKDRAAEPGQCPQIPKVSWWGITSHEELIKHINRSLAGNWSLYHATWENHLDRLMKAFEQGTGIMLTKSKVDIEMGEIQRKGAVKEDKIELAREDLGLYIPKVIQRMAVHRCLDNEMESRSKPQTAAVLPPPQEEEESARSMEEVLGYGWVLKTKCRPVPDVKWWRYRTHKSIAGYVTRKHKGDWKPYIEIWTVRLVKLQDIHQRGTGAIIRTGVTLEGPALGTYVEQMGERLSVIRCLAAEAAADKAGKSAAGQ